MAEYISRDEVMRKFLNRGDGYITMLTMRDMINEVPSADVQPANQWISVKDRLPEEMQDKSINSDWSEELRPSDNVLILTTGGSYDVAWYSHAFDDWTTGNEKHSYENWEVAYWQPLPELPKEAENESLKRHS